MPAHSLLLLLSRFRRYGLQCPLAFPLLPRSPIAALGSPLMTSSLSNPAVSFQSSTSWPSSCGLALWLAPLISDLNRPSWTPLFGCPPFSLPFCLTPTPGALAEYTILTVFVISEGTWRWQHYQETKATPTHPGHTHLLHDEGCDAPRSWDSSEICLGIDNKDVSIGAIGDPELVAIQDVVIS